MSQEQLSAKIKAAAWSAAAELGVNRAIQMLEEVKRELSDSQWSGPGNR